MKAKTKRLITLSSLMVLFTTGCLLVFYNLRGNLVFFYSPTELLEKNDITYDDVDFIKSSKNQDLVEKLDKDITKFIKENKSVQFSAIRKKYG